MNANPKRCTDAERRRNKHGVELPARPRPDLVPEGETRDERIARVLDEHREALEILAKR